MEDQFPSVIIHEESDEDQTIIEEECSPSIKSVQK